MASERSSLDDAKLSLEENGFFKLFAPDVGEQLAEMEQKNFTSLTPYGLTLMKLQVIENSCIRQILEAYFTTCTLGHWLRYRALPNQIESYFQSGPDPDHPEDNSIQGLAVQLLAKDSAVRYYCGSHLLSFSTTESERRLYETSRAAMDESGCSEVKMDFPAGGLVILDARTKFQQVKGYVITGIFATGKIFTNWPPIVIQRTKELEELARSMQSQRIRVNFAFKRQNRSTPQDI